MLVFGFMLSEQIGYSSCSEEHMNSDKEMPSGGTAAHRRFSSCHPLKESSLWWVSRLRLSEACGQERCTEETPGHRALCRGPASFQFACTVDEASRG